MSKDQTEYVIYAIAHPRTKRVRYVGCTENLRQRTAGHWYIRGKSRQRTQRVSVFVADLKARGLFPEFSILETVVGKRAALNREAFWIHHYRNAGSRLLNRPESSFERAFRIRCKGDA